MGLIDVLTQYDTKKKAAHAAKTVKHGVSGRSEPGLGVGFVLPVIYTADADGLLSVRRLVLKSPRSTQSSTPNDSATSSLTFLHNTQM